MRVLLHDGFGIQARPDFNARIVQSRISQLGKSFKCRREDLSQVRVQPSLGVKQSLEGAVILFSLIQVAPVEAAEPPREVFPPATVPGTAG